MSAFAASAIIAQKSAAHPSGVITRGQRCTAAELRCLNLCSAALPAGCGQAEVTAGGTAAAQKRAGPAGCGSTLLAIWPTEPAGGSGRLPAGRGS
jgi:hypothetical protein